jgi:Peptidase M15
MLSVRDSVRARKEQLIKQNPQLASYQYPQQQLQPQQQPQQQIQQGQPQPIITSSAQTPSTPFFNPENPVGQQYQNVPPQAGQNNGNPFLGNPFLGNPDTSRYTAGNPVGYSSSQNTLTSNLSITGRTQNFKDAFPEGVKAECKTSYGMDIGGRCPKPESWTGLSEEVKIDATRLCNLTGQRLKVNNAYRNPICNARVGGAPKSEHKNGTALDINLSGSYRNNEERIIAYLYFIAHGYNGLGTYSSGEPHHVDRRNYLERWGPGQKGCNDGAQTALIKASFNFMGLKSFCDSKKSETLQSMAQKAKNALRAMGKEKFIQDLEAPITTPAAGV